MIDDRTLSGMLLRLQEPWWTPLPPEDYVLPNPNDGKPAGIGLIAGFHFGEWNLTAALMGSLVGPCRFEEHSLWVAAFVTATNVLGPAKIAGQNLASYASLMTPAQFSAWLRTIGRPPWPSQQGTALLDGIDAALHAKAQ